MIHDEIALSPSIAHTLTSESALHAWTVHRLLGNRPKPVTDAQEKGKVIHSLLLQDGEGLCQIDADNFRTKAAQEERDEARSRGEIPILSHKYTEAKFVATKIRHQIESLGWDLSKGKAELRVSWTERDEILCTGVLDWLREDHALIIDLKTTDGSAHPDTCAQRLLKDGGCIQDAAYRSGIEHQFPGLAGRVDMIFMFAQTVEPYCITPVECAGSMREIGEARWARALDKWSECLRAGTDAKHWPGYSQGIVRVEAPSWAVQRELLEGIDDE